jgi:site-specific recombinase XerD
MPSELEQCSTAASEKASTAVQRQAHLRAENKAARTVQTYLEAVRQLDAFLPTRSVDLAGAGREDLEAFLAELLARWKPATAANRYRALRICYAWLEDEGEIAADPMVKMKPPRVPRAGRPGAQRTCCGGC